MLLQKVNADASLCEALEASTLGRRPEAPIMATPAAIVAATPGIAKAAGFIVGAAAVTCAAYVAYKTATG